MAIARGILDGGLRYSNGVADVLTYCTTCRNCVEACGAVDMITGEPKINATTVTEAMRADVVNLGLTPEPYKRLSSRIEEDRNPYSEPKENRNTWAKGLDIPQKADIMLFVGCTLAYRRLEIPTATAKILKKLEVTFGILNDEWCCGSPLWRTGNLKLAEKMAQHNMEALKNAKTVITSCAGCARALREDYPKILGNLPFEVLHFTEYLNRLVKEGKLKPEKKIVKKVTYHDPCHIGRHLGIFDEPREVLKSIPGVELREMSPTRENAWCCGAGGGVKISHPELAVEIATDRLKHAKEVGAETIVSSCPFCKTNLLDAIQKTGSNLEMLDITELVALSMGI
jgi:heterodisulfide reductase subunit D